jgi:hypothetical protein
MLHGCNSRPALKRKHCIFMPFTGMATGRSGEHLVYDEVSIRQRALEQVCYSSSVFFIPPGHKILTNV